MDVKFQCDGALWGQRGEPGFLAVHSPFLTEVTAGQHKRSEKAKEIKQPVEYYISVVLGA
jgi:hypothetical protein